MAHAIKQTKPDASSFYRAVYGVLKSHPPSLQQFLACMADDVDLPTESAFVKQLRAAVSEDLSLNDVERWLKSGDQPGMAWIKRKPAKEAMLAYVKKMVKKRTTPASSLDEQMVASMITRCFTSDGGRQLFVVTKSTVNANRHAFFLIKEKRGLQDPEHIYSYMVFKTLKADNTGREQFKPDPKIEINLPEWKLPNRFSFQHFIDDNYKYGATRSSLFPSQRFVKDFIRVDNPYRGLLLYHGLGAGKCHARDTPILMYDGSVRMVQDVMVGDLVMGDDSLPRTVVSLARGTDHLYDIIQEYGDTYRVNSAHILCLMHPVDGVFQVECTEYLEMCQRKKQLLKGYVAAIEFSSVATACSPYMLGFWLADAGPPKLLDYPKIPIVLKHLKRSLMGTNMLALRRLLEKEKHLPQSYIRNTLQVRHKVLAGLFDADGCMSRHGILLMVGSVDLAREIMFVGRSVGLFVKMYRQPRRRQWLVRMYGPNVGTIGCKFHKRTNALVRYPTQAIHVVYAGFDQYFGFAVDGNHRYVLGDCTVTHNSCAAIVASENLIGSMKVEVMLPASLQTNFVDEIKHRCGNAFFSANKHWRFVSIEQLQQQINAKKKDDALKYASDVTMVDKAIMRKNKGIWIADKDTTRPNFSTLGDAQKAAINQQLNSVIKNKYNFINYNGLSYEAVKALATKPENPFNDKVVIIDEVHNFISRVLGQGKTGTPLYNLILRAKNCKLILLSGTPLINHPYELSYIVNLVRGVQEVHALALDTPESLNKAESVLSSSEYVDSFEMNVAESKAHVQLCPQGFRFSNKRTFMVSRDPSNRPTDEILANLCKELGCRHDGKREHLVMPTDKDKFISTFIDETSGKIKNEFQLARRVMGTISHYATVGSDFPTLKPTKIVYVEMSAHQFSKYEEVRLTEIKKEAYRKRGAGAGLFADLPSTYRAYSRMCCNFVFPEGISRPYKATKKSADLFDDDSDPTYIKAARQLEENFRAHFQSESLAKLSPKTTELLKNINGKCLIYSEYVIVEGLGHIALALRANGWTEMRLKKTGGGWTLDIEPEDMKKPKFFRFQTDNDDVEIMKSLFNNELDRVPSAILKELGGQTNLRGEMLKAILISKSGAEGISLKHVRQVHVMEPYWHEVRINQIIGRAVRANSHADLPASERNVQVYRYMSKFTQEQIKGSKTLKNIDKKMTTDEHVYNIAFRKDQIISSVQRVMMAAAVDCKIHKHRHPDVECIVFPNTDDTAFNMDIDKDDLIVVKKKTSVQPKRYRECVINNVHYAYDGSTNTLYDIDAYKSGRLVRLGSIAKDAANNWRMTRAS